MALTPGTWYVESLRGGFIIRAPGGPVVRGAGGFRTHDDALACAYLPELRAAAAALLTSAERWHGWDNQFHRTAVPNCPDCAAMSRMRGLLGVIPGPEEG